MIVLDTNVISELVRREPNAGVIAWLDALAPGDLATTAVTAAELRYGLARLPDGQRKAALEAAVTALLDEDLRGRVEPFDATAAAHYADVMATRAASGRPVSVTDAQIAAICRRLGAPLATRNVKDFADTGIDVIDPWQAG